jgi:hypothetical protein
VGCRRRLVRPWTRREARVACGRTGPTARPSRGRGRGRQDPRRSNRCLAVVVKIDVNRNGRAPFSFRGTDVGGDGGGGECDLRHELHGDHVADREQAELDRGGSGRAPARPPKGKRNSGRGLGRVRGESGEWPTGRGGSAAGVCGGERQEWRVSFGCSSFALAVGEGRF